VKHWKKILWIGTVILRITYQILKVFSDPDAWLWVLTIITSMNILTLSQEQIMNIVKAGSAFCCFITHLWMNHD
jgi:hypothetical protein